VEKILPLLTKAEDGPSFHVVAPSLPNFGFSQGATKPGFGIAQYAEAMHKVMLNLGYHQYVTQGGDWGYKVTRFIGILYPEHCLASHLNMVLARPPQFTKQPLLYLQDRLLPYSAEEKAGQARSAWFGQASVGYNIQQSTKPATIGFALEDSPVALLAWIYEKLREWSDAYPWTDDEILTWVCIYQFARAGPSASARIYYEVQAPENVGYSDKVYDYVPGVKFGLSTFPQDIMVVPRTWGRTLGDVVFESWHRDGGHFAAHERPEELVGDLRKMFGKGGGAYSIARALSSTKST
jgi:pimeloyl-ACP methyl ester carboxylesterase